MTSSRIINVGSNKIGIIGLDAALSDMADDYADRPDSVVGEELLRRLENKNYIPDQTRQAYSAAFVREFRQFLGQPFSEDVPSVLEIKVLGQGCAMCRRLTDEVWAVLSELNIAADVEHVTDIKAIAKSGVLGVPALLVNGRVVSLGKVPPREKIKEWIKQGG